MATIQYMTSNNTTIDATALLSSPVVYQGTPTPLNAMDSVAASRACDIFENNLGADHCEFGKVGELRVDYDERTCGNYSLNDASTLRALVKNARAAADFDDNMLFDFSDASAQSAAALTDSSAIVFSSFEQAIDEKDFTNYLYSGRNIAGIIIANNIPEARIACILGLIDGYDKEASYVVVAPNALEDSIQQARLAACADTFPVVFDIRETDAISSEVRHNHVSVRLSAGILAALPDYMHFAASIHQLGIVEVARSFFKFCNVWDDSLTSHETALRALIYSLPNYIRAIGVTGDWSAKIASQLRSLLNEEMSLSDISYLMQFADLRAAGNKQSNEAAVATMKMIGLVEDIARFAVSKDLAYTFPQSAASLLSCDKDRMPMMKHLASLDRKLIKAQAKKYHERTSFTDYLFC